MKETIGHNYSVNLHEYMQEKWGERVTSCCPGKKVAKRSPGRATGREASMMKHAGLVWICMVPLFIDNGIWPSIRHSLFHLFLLKRGKTSLHNCQKLKWEKKMTEHFVNYQSFNYYCTLLLNSLLSSPFWLLKARESLFLVQEQIFRMSGNLPIALSR